MAPLQARRHHVDRWIAEQVERRTPSFGHAPGVFHFASRGLWVIETSTSGAVMGLAAFRCSGSNRTGAPVTTGFGTESGTPGFCYPVHERLSFRGTVRLLTVTMVTTKPPLFLRPTPTCRSAS